MWLATTLREPPVPRNGGNPGAGNAALQDSTPGLLLKRPEGQHQ